MSDPYTSPVGADIDPSSVSYIGRVTFNANPDQKLIKLVRRVDTRQLLYRDAAIGEEGTWDFKNPELVMMKKQEVRQLNGGRPGQDAIVISSVSGVLRAEQVQGRAYPQTLVGEEARRADIMENYTLAGIVQGPVTTHRDNVSSQVVSITCGGLLSIVNTGSEPIYAGAKVYWDWPKLTKDGNADKSSYTVPPYYKTNKIPVVVRTFTYSSIPRRIPDEIAAQTNASAKMIRGLVALAGVLGVNNLTNAQAADVLSGNGLTVAERDAMFDFFGGVMAVHNKFKDRIFGQAKSNAARGVKVDIVFGSYRH